MKEKKMLACPQGTDRRDRSQVVWDMVPRNQAGQLSPVISLLHLQLCSGKNTGRRKQAPALGIYGLVGKRPCMQ